MAALGEADSAESCGKARVGFPCVTQCLWAQNRDPCRTRTDGASAIPITMPTMRSWTIGKQQAIKYLMGAGHPAVSEANREAVLYDLRSRETWRAMRRASDPSCIGSKRSDFAPPETERSDLE